MTNIEKVLSRIYLNKLWVSVSCSDEAGTYTELGNYLTIMLILSIIFFTKCCTMVKVLLVSNTVSRTQCSPSLQACSNGLLRKQAGLLPHHGPVDYLAEGA